MSGELVTMALQMVGCIVVTVPVAFGAMWLVFWYADNVRKR